MGYYSGVRGVVRMTEESFHRMMGIRVKLPSFSEPLTLEEFFEEITYQDGYCGVDSYGKHYDLEYMIELLARFKEDDTADEVFYQGDSGIDDSGTYFILPGKWAFVSVRYPVIDDVKEGDWVKTLRPDHK
jgi:hypothetical protein